MGAPTILLGPPEKPFMLGLRMAGMTNLEGNWRDVPEGSLGEVGSQQASSGQEGRSGQVERTGHAVRRVPYVKEPHKGPDQTRNKLQGEGRAGERPGAAQT